MKKIMSILLLVGLSSIEISDCKRVPTTETERMNLRPRNSCCGGSGAGCCAKSRGKKKETKKAATTKGGSCNTGRCCSRKSS